MIRPLQTCPKCGERTRNIIQIAADPKASSMTYTYKCACGFKFVVTLGVPPQRPKTA